MSTAVPSSAAIPGLQLKETSLLVVDDNPTTLHLLATTLEKEGYQVTRATDGLEALDVLKAHKQDFDVIILDRMMPRLDGIGVTRQIFEDPDLKYIPIVMATAADKPEEISEGIKAGVFYYLTKPIERHTLLSVVQSAVKEVEQRRVLRAEMERHRQSFGLIQVLKSTYRTLDEAESLASFLANCFPDPDRALTGISELLINAVEHGNLGIRYEEKTRLIEENSWREEIGRRLESTEFRDREVVVIYERKDQTYYLQITDQWEGFNWKNFLEFDPSRAWHNHGRGIAMANMIAFDRLVYNDKGNQVTAVMQVQDKDEQKDDYWG